MQDPDGCCLGAEVARRRKCKALCGAGCTRLSIHGVRLRGGKAGRFGGKGRLGIYGESSLWPPRQGRDPRIARAPTVTAARRGRQNSRGTLYTRARWRSQAQGLGMQDPVGVAGRGRQGPQRAYGGGYVVVEGLVCPPAQRGLLGGAEPVGDHLARCLGVQGLEIQDPVVGRAQPGADAGRCPGRAGAVNGRSTWRMHRNTCAGARACVRAGVRVCARTVFRILRVLDLRDCPESC